MRNFRNCRLQSGGEKGACLADFEGVRIKLKVLRFLEDGASLSGVEGAEFTALCMNFIDNSLDETAFGVSGAMAGGWKA